MREATHRCAADAAPGLAAGERTAGVSGECSEPLDRRPARRKERAEARLRPARIAAPGAGPQWPQGPKLLQSIVPPGVGSEPHEGNGALGALSLLNR
jgi:hypothetical protein